MLNFSSLRLFYCNYCFIWNTFSGLIFNITLFSVGDLPGYFSAPIYFFVNLSMCLSASSPVICSITFPLIVTVSYGLLWSVTANATRGSREIFLCYILPIAVLTRIAPFSISTHVGVTWGDPSFINVDIKTKFLSLNSFRIESSFISPLIWGVHGFSSLIIILNFAAISHIFTKFRFGICLFLKGPLLTMYRIML